MRNDSNKAGLFTNFSYTAAASKHLKGYYGYILKNAYESISSDITSGIIPLTLTKNTWTLPIAYSFLSTSLKATVYKSNTTRYNTAAIVDYDIRNGPTKIQYINKSSRHLSSYIGYIDKTIYQGLSGVVDVNNWANAPQLTANDGILVSILQPSDALNTASPNTALRYIINETTSIVDIGSTIDKVDELGWMQLQFRTASINTVTVNFLLYQSDGTILINNTQTLTGVTSSSWHTNKRAYITTNNKNEKYISSPTLTDPKNWAISGASTFHNGVLLTFIDPTDPSNSYSPNTALRTIINGFPTTSDVGSALATVNQNGLIHLSYTLTDATTVTVTAVLIQAGGAVLHTVNLPIAVTDSAVWIQDRLAYLSTNDITESHTTVSDNPVNWALDDDLTLQHGFLIRILAPNDPLNTTPTNTAILIINNGTTTVQDTSAVKPILNKNAQISIMSYTSGANTKTITYKIFQGDGSSWYTNTFTIGGIVDTDAWDGQKCPYITTNNPTESYVSRLVKLTTQIFNGDEINSNIDTVERLAPSDPNSTIVMSVDIHNATTIKVDYTFYDSSSTVLAQDQLTYTVENSTNWFTNKRFFITTNNPTETYTVAKKYVYTPNPSVTGPSLQIDTNIRSVRHIDSFPEITYDADTYNPTVLSTTNWSNNINLTKREGILMNLNFVSGVGTAFEDGSTVTMTQGLPLNNSKLDTNGYIQIAVERSTNNIIYEIVIIKSNGTKIGQYNATLTTSNGATWIADITKRCVLTTNNTLHTFRATETVHTYLGTTITPTNGFINTGDTGFQSYTSDFANIIAGKSFTVGTIPSSPLPLPIISNINTHIISLMGQIPSSLNGFYYLESLDDIKDTGIRLSWHLHLCGIFPKACLTISVPSRVFKIPMRFRRLLRRITNMGGL